MYYKSATLDSMSTQAQMFHASLKCFNILSLTSVFFFQKQCIQNEDAVSRKNAKGWAQARKGTTLHWKQFSRAAPFAATNTKTTQEGGGET